MVAAVQSDYLQKCLAPLESCTPTEDSLRSFSNIETFCGSAAESVCDSSLDCAWDAATTTGAPSRTARWRVLCDHDRHTCPQGPGCSRTCTYGACAACTLVESQWCQSVFDSVIQSCGGVSRNATRVSASGAVETYADWPFEGERNFLQGMGCDAGPFSTSHGLERFLQQQVANVCSLAMSQLGRDCGCSTDEQGVQACDPLCLTSRCQETFIQWHDACCDARDAQGVRTCTRGPMTVIADQISPGPLDASNAVCEAERAALVNPNPLPPPIQAMCIMAWDTIYSWIENAGLTSCDVALFIQNTFYVCSDWSQMDGQRIPYGIIEDPNYCATFFTCGTHAGDTGVLDTTVLTEMGTCSDVDECLVQNGGCAETCINNFGAPPTCTCPGGLENPPACDRCSNLCACPSLLGGTVSNPNTPCENGGVCANGGTDTFECQCQAGFSGPFCEVSAENCELDYSCPYVPDVAMRDGRGAYFLEAFAPLLLNSHSDEAFIGIGTQAPQSKVDVAGKMRVEGDLEVKGKINVLGVSLDAAEMKNIDTLLCV